MRARPPIARHAVLLALTAFAGCRCHPGPGLRSAETLGFRATPGELDFGRVLEGTRKTLEVEVVSTSRAPIAAALRADPPFHVAGASLELPPEGVARIEVAFDADDGDVQGELEISAPPFLAAVQLRGTGVAPLPCVPAGQCHVSTFDVGTGACVDALAPEGTSCDPQSLCLVNGRCSSEGTCEGDVRSCDDGDVCTADFCSATYGCMHRMKSCPASRNPCLVATCDPVDGCGLAAAPDLSVCGSVDCIQGHLCLSGACVTAPTPDGFPCAPATACQGAGTCQSQECVRPDAGELPPAFHLAISGGPAQDGDPGRLVASGGNLFAEICSGDAGCSLGSWTANGFERFVSPSPDGQLRRAITASPQGVWVLAGDGLELYSAVDAAPISRVPFSALWTSDGGGTTGGERIALSSTGELWVAVGPRPQDADAGADGGDDAGSPDDAGTEDAGTGDAGTIDADAGPLPFSDSLVRISSDGGSWTEYPLWQGGALALSLDVGDRVYVLRPADGLGRFEEDDAGFRFEPWGPPAASSGLAIGRGVALVGGAALFDVDSGTPIGTLRDAGEEGEPVYPLPGPVLVTRTGSFALYRSCTTPYVDPCAGDQAGLWIRSFEPADAGVSWAAEVMAPPFRGWVEEMVSVDGGVGLVTQVLGDGGDEVRIQGFYGGSKYLDCPVQGGGRIGAALFEGSFLYAIIERDGGWSLEGFDLTGAPIDTSGWPAANGAAGTRRERP